MKKKFSIKLKTCKNNEMIQKVSDTAITRRVSEGVVAERIYSEGEISSNSETIFSVDSKDDFNDLDFISLVPKNESNNDCKITLKVENKFTSKNETGGETCFQKERKEGKTKSITSSNVNDNRKKKCGSFKTYNWQSNNEDKNANFDKKNKRSREREDCGTKQSASYYRKRSKRSVQRTFQRRRSRYSRSERTFLSSSSRSPERNTRSRSSRRNTRSKSPERNTRSRSPERNTRSRSSGRNTLSRSPKRNTRSRSSNYKGRTSRHSESYRERNSKSSYRISSRRKRRQNSHSKSPSPSVWKTFYNRRFPTVIKNYPRYSYKRPAINSCYRWGKKERTHFSEQKQKKEAETSETSKKESLKEQTNEGNAQMSESHQNSKTSNIHQPDTAVQISFPTLSTDNLPLVPGPQGLPVHIMMTGEQILHDMDGRRIPLGPYGYYLPLDPMGRLFPHIVSPLNQAVPVHMTEDGVLRLPNSTPVPYGPNHRFPVNIDGSIIFVAPDSKPLLPCTNLPKEPPLHSLKTVSFDRKVDNAKVQQTVPKTVDQQVKVQQNQSTDLSDAQSTKFQTPLVVFVKDGPKNLIDLLSRNEKGCLKRNEEVFKSLKIEDGLEINLSNENVKTSTSKKLSEEKNWKDDTCTSDSDMNLDSNDLSLSPPDFKTESAPNEDISGSDDEQEILKSVMKICDKKTTKEEAGEDLVKKKILQTIKLLREENCQPPAFGRFIISNLPDFVQLKSPNESPLTRNRIKLPFLTPDFKNVFHFENQQATEKKSTVSFRFLPQKKPESPKESLPKIKLSVLKFDIGVQCDALTTTDPKISRLEAELTRLRIVNENLLEGYRSVQAMSEKKGDELKKALLQVQEKNDEILSLKNAIKK